MPNHLIRAAFALALSAAPLSAQGLEAEQIAPGIWVLEGPAEQRSADNLGNNATFGLIDTADGAILIDPGGTWAGAEALDAVIGRLTDHPITTVINTGGQDHRWMGNGYWQAQGAEVIASEVAVADQQARASLQLSMLRELVGEAGLARTNPAPADVTFSGHYAFTQGGVSVELFHQAPAHTPGDSFVWLPEAGIVFAGDIVFVGRLLGILEVSDSAGWIESFDAMAALEPRIVVPGHGPATSLATARADTRDYLVAMRAAMRAHIDAGGDILGAVAVDQSAFEHLDQFEALAGRNAQTLFQQMEWE
ncbi:SoxH protein,-like protein [Roseibacterium elongatum DSM 19469]|uniref:SoxH protein,-like protein n=1 Tax=Roseicyclus elongatus DSM 19469 TaxID=1294273 RepID=W8SMM0_9RHOB|nr:MBL fold metallo-hydrolase [Roseibacterium elongatum]AHM03785.1 SoxH protein,-like protein [Roseibacterium elongatum DSM 19469]